MQIIKSKEDYHFFLECDRLSMTYTYKKPRFYSDEVWKFTRLLRKVEYINNCPPPFFWQNYFNVL